MPVILRQDFHLTDGDGVELCQPLGLRHSFADEHGIQVLQIGKADQLRDIGVVTDIPFSSGWLSRHCFAVIPNRAMFNTSASLAYTMETCFAVKALAESVLLDGICMDSIVDLGQISLDVPAQAVSFLGLEPLKLLDQIQFEFDESTRQTRRQSPCERRFRHSGQLWR